MNCTICEKKLEKKEEKLCQSCLSFVKWKYGSLENYEIILSQELGGAKE